MQDKLRRTLFRHPLAAVGGALFLAGGALFVILLMMDLTSSHGNPYRALVTFVVAPALITIGFLLFLLSTWLQVRDARKKGEEIRFTLSIDPSDPQYMKNLWRFLAISAALVILLVYSGYRGYEATDSVGFCGEVCHEVMEPQSVTYHNSPHARVPCVECHIGPGASFWVKSKVDGLRQLYATAVNSYSRPIETPVENLRPAQETCEECHWPQQFYGEKLVTKTYFRSDEENSPHTIKLLVKIGGGNPRTGEMEGIHWHMLGANKIEYIAADRKRQDIIWARLVTADNDTMIYSDPDADLPDLSDPEVEIRQFDCIDCHNRPSHLFQPPATLINLALSTGQISTDLPYVRELGLELLNDEYETKPAALAKIPESLTEYYNDNYPELLTTHAGDIAAAGQALNAMYKNNFFPEMNTDYRVRENNLSHFVNDGCFRCHDGVMENQNGGVVSNDCSTCHLIVAQGPSANLSDLDSDIEGLEFSHPEDIDEAWKDMKCTECHDPESGY